MTRVLLIGNGDYYHIAAFFHKALGVLGLQHVFINDRKFFRTLDHSIAHKLAYRLLKRPMRFSSFNKEIVYTARNYMPDLVLIPKGAFITAKTLAQIKQDTGAVLVNFATDDPFNPAASTPDMIASIPVYDLYACTKRAIMDDVRRAGCLHVQFIPFAYEPSLHFPELPASKTERSWFGCDLAFIGGADAIRLPLFRKLARIPGVDLHLYGSYWKRDKDLRSNYRGMALGRDYRLALGGCKIAVGLLRHANRDQQTMRTFEIPACGTFMLAQRTDEHLEFFDEDKEAAYFSSDEELIEKARYFTRHEEQRQRIATAGYRRVVDGHNTYQDRLEKILGLAELLR